MSESTILRPNNYRVIRPENPETPWGVKIPARMNKTTAAPVNRCRCHNWKGGVDQVNDLFEE